MMTHMVGTTVETSESLKGATFAMITASGHFDELFESIDCSLSEVAAYHEKHIDHMVVETDEPRVECEELESIKCSSEENGSFNSV